ncbi:hypothetical protein PIB30_106062, partial [Stylosanthes scabra]|nr:hypothetical protein [Stylosanthes scabra]
MELLKSLKRMSGNRKEEEFIRKSGTSRKRHAHKSHANKSNMGGNKQSVEDKSPINKEYVTNSSQKTPTIEKMAILGKSTPNGYSIDRCTSLPENLGIKKEE